jgi:RNA polymerase sigma-70 factor (ECF subfamily)
MATSIKTSPDQRLLLASAQAGDERAFRNLVGPYRRALELHCYRMLGSVQDSEDIVQETLLRAWRGLESFEPRAGIQSWLYRIATNACLDELERRPRRPQPIQPHPDTPIDEAAAPTYDPAARYALREGLELALLSAIQQLPGRQRAVLILRDVLGWTSPEVADLLGSTGAAVNSALQRARVTVDQHLPARALESAEPAERDLLRRYVDAWDNDDVDGLTALLRQDAVLRMPPQPSVRGAREIATFFRERAARGDLRRMQLTPTRANGRPAAAVHERRGDRTLVPHGILVFEAAPDAIAGIDAFTDPTLLPLFGYSEPR